MGRIQKNNYNFSNYNQSLRTGTLSFGEESLRFSHTGVGTHSLRSIFAMEIFLEILYPEKIMIIGQCSINDFLWYIRIQFSNLVVPIRDFYKIPESEVIYYTLGQPEVQSHRLNIQQGTTNTTTSSNLLQLEHARHLLRKL